MIKPIAAGVFLFVLAACGDVSTSPPDPAETSKSPLSEAPQEFTLGADTMGADQPKEQPALDLTLPDKVDLDSDTQSSFDEQALLPNLFENQQGNQKLGLGIRVITDSNEGDYLDSVIGAEIQVDVSTN